MIERFTSQNQAVDSEPERGFVFWPCSKTYFKQQASLCNEVVYHSVFLSKEASEIKSEAPMKHKVVSVS